MLNDFDKVLSLLCSQSFTELQNYNEKDFAAYTNNDRREPPITTVIKKTTDIWNELLPSRKITIKDYNVYTKNGDENYLGKEMSDGERVILYMICQVIVQRPNTLIIIDEPELHIHRAILEDLWTRLENERIDCSFMYITHDLGFALSRLNAQILWVKSFDGTEWDYNLLNMWTSS